jgi:hypothetical protein
MKLTGLDKEVFFRAWGWCDLKDKSTEFTLTYLKNVLATRFDDESDVAEAMEKYSKEYHKFQSNSDSDEEDEMEITITQRRSLLYADMIEMIHRRFEERISTKTGWGKNEIITVHNQVMIEIMADTIAGLTQEDDDEQE